ncbi:hypothetical protein D3C86_1548380 [compost metagenome]
MADETAAKVAYRKAYVAPHDGQPGFNGLVDAQCSSEFIAECGQNTDHKPGWKPDPNAPQVPSKSFLIREQCEEITLFDVFFFFQILKNTRLKNADTQQQQ